VLEQLSEQSHMIGYVLNAFAAQHAFIHTEWIVKRIMPRLVDQLSLFAVFHIEPQKYLGPHL
jgi:hypothetical protein